jgi:hypothetical protein
MTPLHERVVTNAEGSFRREAPRPRVNKQGKPMDGYTKTVVLQPDLYLRLLAEAERQHINTSSLIRVILSDTLPALPAVEG